MAPKLPPPKPPLSGLPGLPKQYSGFANVFCKRQAETLLPHRPNDCPINLLPGMTHPLDRIYSTPCLSLKPYPPILKKYPLPLISALFDRIHRAQVFSKLDLRGGLQLSFDSCRSERLLSTPRMVTLNI